MNTRLRRAVFSAAALLLLVTFVVPAYSASTTSYSADSIYVSAPGLPADTDSSAAPPPAIPDEEPQVDPATGSGGVTEADETLPDAPQDEVDPVSPDPEYPMKGNGKGQSNGQGQGLLLSHFKKTK